MSPTMCGHRPFRIILFNNSMYIREHKSCEVNIRVHFLLCTGIITYETFLHVSCVTLSVVALVITVHDYVNLHKRKHTA